MSLRPVAVAVSAPVLDVAPTETGYATVERPGVAPQPGDTVLLPIGRYKVSRRGASPFPEDTRGCAYLIQA